MLLEAAVMDSVSAEHERWHTLCEQAANEQDLERLLQLVQEINRLLIKRLLQEKEESLLAQGRNE